ncbi:MULTISPECIES: helix-turn-helix domain-containing protein [Comamonadaceae]|nr:MULTISPECIES: helix-turn-helix transcriptional regulator [Comamonadaceae]MDH0202780.1 helix-turn-helix domain-containing protein [Comamonas aquatica]MDH1447869.1 helix-turn-helix domain-containing protein [Comamonas aquatica]WQM80701.1 helix-turn-helix transcriptional regulator [Delftia tsuruhatensis]
MRHSLEFFSLLLSPVLCVLYDSNLKALCRIRRWLKKHIGRPSADMRVKESAPSQLSATPVVKLPNAVTQALGAKLRSYRELAQKSQEQLAHDAEVERSRISKLENGHINPSLLTLATLCHCLGITLAELFDGVTATLPPASQGGELRRRNQAHAEKNPAPSKAVGADHRTKRSKA